MMRVSSITLVFLFLISCSNQNQSAEVPKKKELRFVPHLTVERDIQGFPHIDAPDEASAYFGLGYMQAEDYRAELLLKLALVSGRSASLFDNQIIPLAASGAPPTAHIFGTDDLPIPSPPTPQLPSLLDLDKTVYFYNYYDNARSIYEKLPPQDRKNLQAFVNGINAAVEKNWQVWVAEGDFRYSGFEQFHLFEYRTNVYDVIQNSLDLFTWGSVMNLQRKVDDLHQTYEAAAFKSANPTKYVKTEKFRKQYRKDVRDISYPPKKYTSSNQWAFRGGATGLEHSIHVTDPHIPIFDVQYNVYGFQLRYPGGMAAGGTLTGFPNMLIGTNGHITWSHTAHADGTMSAWTFEMNPINSDQYRTYRTNGYEDYRTKSYSIDVRNYGRVDFTVKDTTHGRVIFLNEIAQMGAAFRQGRNGEFQIFKEYYALTRSKSVKEAKKIMSMLQVPTFNTFLTDANNIYYLYNSITPRRSDAIKWNKIMNAMDPEHDWDPNDLLTFDELPQLENPPTGYLINCNISPDQVTHDSGIDLSKYPEYLIINNKEPFITYRQQKALDITRRKVKRLRRSGLSLSEDDVYELVTEDKSLKYVELVERAKRTFIHYVDTVPVEPIEDLDDHTDEPIPAPIPGDSLTYQEIANIKRELELWNAWQAEGAPTNIQNTITPRVEYYRYLMEAELNSAHSDELKTYVKGAGHYVPEKIQPLTGDTALLALRKIATLDRNLRDRGAQNITWGEVNRLSTTTAVFPIAGSPSSIRSTGGHNSGGLLIGVSGGQTWVQAVFHNPDVEKVRSTVSKPFWGPFRFTAPWFNNASERFSKEHFENFFIRKGELTEDNIVERLILRAEPM